MFFSFVCELEFEFLKCLNIPSLCLRDCWVIWKNNQLKISFIIILFYSIIFLTVSHFFLFLSFYFKFSFFFSKIKKIRYFYFLTYLEELFFSFIIPHITTGMKTNNIKEKWQKKKKKNFQINYFLSLIIILIYFL